MSGSAQFARVYGARTRVSAGPLLIYAAPNDSGQLRLGLSVSRKLGTAVRRNRIKRLIREAFRHLEPEKLDIEQGYDVVVSVRPHDPRSAAEYAENLTAALRALHNLWSKRVKRDRKRHNDLQ